MYEGSWTTYRATGPWRVWYLDGQLAFEGSFLDDVPIGTAREWHVNGRLSRELVFQSGDPVAISCRSWTTEGDEQGECTTRMLRDVACLQDDPLRQCLTY